MIMHGDLILFVAWCAMIVGLFAWLVWLFVQSVHSKRRTDELYEAAREVDRAFYAALWEYLNREDDNA
jgi:hypothetical protein